ncbi:sporulation protein YtfJ [Virgibacillus dakarensis]|uniref:Spore protein YtfJ n=1 Tax=Lentibacillus populi TaxID=1827502 RepID=A0A9W5TTL7_9BACI|nr:MULTISPECIES: GerW family sporulation protein [Bacillaceae]MBT2216592.1 GerW family sporulation protein [Virgibacillus dakarensis]MTW84314.1 sporulation protein YtfJ [Virgibacillus dakarensis]GGB27356.1 putative spore protein YtfJ [Lentibacillus populi]
MSEHPIQGLMTTAMENLKDMVEVNTIIGDPVESPDGSVIIPVSKVGFGFAAGGSEFSGKKKGSDSDQGDSGGGQKEMPFGGGSGGGVSITPVAFLIVNAKGIKMVHLDGNTHLIEKMLDFAPQVVEKIQQLLKESGRSKKPKNQNKDKDKEEEDKQHSIYDI